MSTQIAATGVLGQYTTLTRRNADMAAGYAQAVIEAARLGLIPVSAVAGYLREILGAAAVTAVLLADLGVAADLSRRTGTVVPPLTLDLPDATVDTIRAAVDTVTADIDWNAVRNDDDEALAVVTRIERLAKAVPLQAGQDAQNTALRKRDVELYVRALDSGACALCRSLADGTVRAIDQNFIAHPNCNCVRAPILDPNVKEGDKVTDVPDTYQGPERTLSIGHGLYREQISKIGPGLTVRHSAPRVSDPDRFDPRLNGAISAAARANRGRRVVTPLAPVYDLNEFRKRKTNGK